MSISMERIRGEGVPFYRTGGRGSSFPSLSMIRVKWTMIRDECIYALTQGCFMLVDDSKKGERRPLCAHTWKPCILFLVWLYMEDQSNNSKWSRVIELLHIPACACSSSGGVWILLLYPLPSLHPYSFFKSKDGPFGDRCFICNEKTTLVMTLISVTVVFKLRYAWTPPWAEKKSAHSRSV